MPICGATLNWADRGRKSLMPVIYSPGPRADKRQSTRAAVLPGERGFRFVSRNGAKALRRKKKGYLTQRHKEDAPSLRLRSVAAGEDRTSTRLNSSHSCASRILSAA